MADVHELRPKTPDSEKITVNLVVKIKRTSPEHPQQFQGVLRLAEGSKRVILSTRVHRSRTRGPDGSGRLLR
jgi:hypothetical protein